MVTIFGSGFGLYGYLPALIEGLNEEVCLPKKYLEIIKSRSDLNQFEEKILWVNDEETAIRCANKIIISVMPSAQYSIVSKCLNLNFQGCFFLEKPLAQSPSEAEKLLNLLDSHGVDYLIGYSFLYLGLPQDIMVTKSKQKSVRLEWEFMAHHFANNLKNWKRNSLEGGGVLRFYGIHVIALLVASGYSEIVSSVLLRDETEEFSLWEAEFSHVYAANCKIIVNSRSENSFFSITTGDTNKNILALDPFLLNGSQLYGIDRRFISLVSFLKDSTDKKILYRAINRMWSLVEECTLGI